MKTTSLKLTNTKNLLPVFNLLVLLCFVSVLQAQGWQKSYPTEYSYKNILNTPVIVAPSSDKGVVFSYSEYSNPDTLSNDRTYKLVKVDQFGVVDWQTKFNNPDPLYHNFTADELLETSDDGYIVFGGFEHAIVGNIVEAMFIKKHDNSGAFEWEKDLYITGLNGKPIATQTIDNGYLVVHKKAISPSISYPHLIKLDSVGNVEWELSVGASYYEPTKVMSHSDGTYTITGYSPVTFLLKIDASGNVIWDNTYNDFTYIDDAIITDDDGYLLGSDDGTEYVFIKMDSVGTVEWSKSFSYPIDLGNTTVSLIQADGGYILSVSGFDLVTLKSISFITKIDETGNVLWERIFYGTVHDITSPEPGYYFLSGNDRKLVSSVENQPQLIKIDEFGNTFPNFLVGNVIHDSNLNCKFDSSETVLKNWLIQAVGNSGTYYGISDSTGKYAISLDTGAWQLEIINNTPVWQACQSKFSINLGNQDTINTDFSMQTYLNCPYLFVDISTTFLRRCTTGYYYVYYCNIGPLPAPNSFVEVEFPSQMDVVSSSIPWSTQSGNTFTFQLGTIGVGDCGTFSIGAMPICDSTASGETMCVEAHIFPDSICAPSDTSWDGSITLLDVNCQPDSVTFVIKNIGSGDMLTPLNYLVIEDHLNMKQAPFELNSMDSLLIKVPSNGSTYRLYAEQSPGRFPADYYPTIAIEGCGINSSGTISLGFITMFQENDVLEQISIDCQEIIGAYDPNDKRAEPKGYGSEHYIEVGDDLNYHIRFQNVGNDTAFLVVIRDTISPHLDLASLQQGTSSHPYQLEIDNGNILKFTFNNILLVDSTTNEPGSHGFVKFKIGQVPNLPLGTMIYNNAGIYFDFEEPVITNQTYHEIGEDFIPILVTSNDPVPEYPEVTISVQPNPFSEFADFILDGAPQGNKSFELYDSMGRLIYQDQFIDESIYRLYKNELSTGIYFYKILNNNRLLISGKLVAGY